MSIINQFTLRVLKQNKIRTIVTIIGIALSAALFTAVPSLIESFRELMIEITVEKDGIHHGILNHISKEGFESLKTDSEVNGMSALYNYGEAEDISERSNRISSEDGYIHVMGIDEKFPKYSHLSLRAGRLAEKQNEIVLPHSYGYDTGMHYTHYQVGDRITLQIGEEAADFSDTEENEEENTGEEQGLQNVKERTFEVVGIYDETYMVWQEEPYAFTGIKGGSLKPVDYGALITLEHPEWTKTLLGRYASMETGEAVFSLEHLALLKLYGKSSNSEFEMSLRALAVILMVIIMIGSVSLIYNAFAISLNERIKLLALFQSVGATKKQIRGSVLFEAFVLGLVGIPSGILTGFAAIRVLLHFVGRMAATVLKTDTAHSLHLVIVPQTVLIAVFAGYVTIFYSALKPVRQVLKRPVLVSLRQNDMIRQEKRKLRTNPLIHKFFGVEGLLAARTYKRNQKKYHTTLFSMILSIVLFVSAGVYAAYLLSETEGYAAYEADIECEIESRELNGNAEKLDRMKKEIKALRSVTEAAYSQLYTGNVAFPVKEYREEFLEAYQKAVEQTGNQNMSWGFLTKDGKLSQSVELCFLDDKSYKRYLEKQGCLLDEYLYDKEPKALLINNREENLSGTRNWKYSGLRLIKDQFPVTLEIAGFNEKTQEKVLKKLTVHVGKQVSGSLPLGVPSFGDMICLLPYSYLENNTFLTKDTDCEYYGPGTFLDLKSSSHAAGTESALKYLGETEPDAAIHVYDMAAEAERARASVLMIEILAYSFIGVMTLIALANILNTISTNITLRRAEFGMLRSAGMEKKGFRRMLGYEGLILGIKSLIGIPVSLGIDYLIYILVKEGFGIHEFLIPWREIGLAVFSVFIVTFLTMRYAYHKTQKLNPIETLREEF